MPECGTQPRPVGGVRVLVGTGLVHDIARQPGRADCDPLRAGGGLECFPADGETLVEVVLGPDLDPLTLLRPLHGRGELPGQRRPGGRSMRGSRSPLTRIVGFAVTDFWPMPPQCSTRDGG